MRMKSNSLFSSILKHKRLMCTTNTRIPHLFTLINQCSNIKHIHQTHGFILFTGLDHDNLILTRFIDSCSSLGFSDYAFSVFTHHKPPPDIHLYNTMIKALSDSPSKAITLFNNIQATGLRPNNYSFPLALKAVVKFSAIEMGRQIHCQTIQTGLDLDLHVLTALIRMYASCARISDARKLFDGLRNRIKHVTLWNAMVAAYAKVGDLNNALALFECMTERNVISWTALISGYAQMDLPNEAITIFRKMQLQNVKPDEIAMLAALSACAQLGALELGVWIHNYINKHGLYTTVPLNNALIDMWKESGMLRKVMKDTGIKKMPGCSYIEVNNRVHEFIAGDTSHLDFDRTYQLQCKMIEQLKVAEHVQNEHFELFEFEER
ncbi:hypothetical protein Q3G72_025674 [Acer saccharum]|nr:hypothetical protein Q3G72_025674 [Acer saccharum]